jgi:hypothetical protein
VVTQIKDYQHALVVGTVRDGSANVVSDLLRIVNALERIVPTSAFVVESDSDDDTVQLLAHLVEIDSRVRFVSLGAISDEFPDRIVRLRHCRNAYIHEIRRNPEYQNCDLIVVADLDGINTKIDTQGFEMALNSNIDWDALAANQSARYYDLAALRHPLWSPNNFFDEAQWMTPFLGKRASWRHSISDRMIRIPPHLPPILVDSAFGGLCIYRRWVFEKCDYSEDEYRFHDEIDHVTLNRKLKSFGGKAFIYPALINAKWTVHSLDGSPFIRFLKTLAHTTPLHFGLPMLRKASLFAAKRK